MEARAATDKLTSHITLEHIWQRMLPVTEQKLRKMMPNSICPSIWKVSEVGIINS